MEKKLVLIDGNSIINRAFYGVPELTSREGLHTNAIYGFLNIMFKVMEEEAPSHMLIAFDEKAPTFRHKMYAEYKGTRKPMPEELQEQVPVLKEVLLAMNIRIYSKGGSFGGLGHPVSDVDTGDILPLGSGEAGAVTISEVEKGTAGEPGMLQGSFTEEAPLGELLCNNRCGVFGKLYHNPTDAAAVPMALKQEIETGPAQILCTVEGDTPKAYDVSLEEIDYSGTDSTRNMTIRVTDNTLLEKTGGIVQGMSGSPIVQNGKLVGDVTHVFVDDPTRGYGIFCENMVRYGLCGS